MPRKPRFFLPDIPVHITQRGLNRGVVFAEDDDYAAFLETVEKAKNQHGCKVHAYAVMTNHYHLLVTPPNGPSLSAMMQTIGRHFVPYINHKYGGSGTIWEGRFKAYLVQEDLYLLNCMRYIEMNPVAAMMVSQPDKYQWSSYNHNARGLEPQWLDHHAEYSALGSALEDCQVSYRGLFEERLSEADSSGIAMALQTGTPLGNQRFKDKIETILGFKVGQAKRGRPARIKSV